jgi:hypothetical protein
LVRLLDRLLDLLAYDALKTSLDLSTTVLCQGPVRFGNVVPKEGDVKNSRNDQSQESDDPDEEGEQHGEVNDRLLLVPGLDQDLDVHEELLKVGAVLGGVFTDGQ